LNGQALIANFVPVQDYARTAGAYRPGDIPSNMSVRVMQVRFEKLGDPVGTTREDIVAVVGPPLVDEADSDDGSRRLFWHDGVGPEDGGLGYATSLSFSGEKCIRVNFEKVNGKVVKR